MCLRRVDTGHLTDSVIQLSHWLGKGGRCEREKGGCGYEQLTHAKPRNENSGGFVSFLGMLYIYSYQPVSRHPLTFPLGL